MPSSLNTEELEPEVIDPGPDKIIAPGFNYTTVTDKIAGVVLKPIQTTPKQWWISLFLAFVAMQGLLAGAFWLFYKGVGVWGIIIPVAWGFAIVNFVWWIGIGHAGTLISAILLLLKQDWRTSINRFSEAMTLFAVAQAGMFPILHLGRPWLPYWLLPYPNSMWLWPNPRSPLIWDVFAVSTYLTVSLIFWFIGLVPDLATMRDRAKQQWQKFIFGMLGHGLARIGQTLGALSDGLPAVGRLGDAAGGFGSHRSELRFCDQLAARLAHHDFPALLRRGRHLFRLCDGGDARDPRQEVVPPGRSHHHAPPGLHGQADAGHRTDCRLWIRDGSVHVLVQRQSARNVHVLQPRHRTRTRVFFWSLILCNILIPQSLWSARVRQSIPRLFCVSIVVNIGMWLERFIIVITSLARDFVPSSWGMYYPTQWDWAVYVGTLGFFLVLMILFVRMLPSISIFEVREVLHHLAPHIADDDGPAPAPAHGD